MISIIFLRFLSWFPLPWIHVLADVIGFCAFYLVKRRTHIALQNVAVCFPEKSLKERQRLVRSHLQGMVRMAFEYGIAWWASPEEVRHLVQVHGREHLEDVRGQACIVLCMHTTAIELCALRFAMEISADCFYRPQKNPYVDAMMRRGRKRFGDTVLLSKHEGLRALVRRLRSGRAILYFPDQDFGPQDSIFVPFFGIPAATVTTVHRLAQLASARILPISMQRQGHAFQLEIHPVWQSFPSDSVEDDVRRMNEWFENCIRKYPTDYFWTHRRFKTRPAGEKSLY